MPTPSLKTLNSIALASIGAFLLTGCAVTTAKKEPVAELAMATPATVMDSDGDGVPDDRDACPDTRPGAGDLYFDWAKPLLHLSAVRDVPVDSAYRPFSAGALTICTGGSAWVLSCQMAKPPTATKPPSNATRKVERALPT